MSNETSTPQVEFWRGDFGNSYTERNTATHRQLAARVAMWSDILKPLVGKMPESILEVGCNLGINLRALRALSPATLYAVEPNESARAVLVRDNVLAQENLTDGFAQSIKFPDRVADLAFTSGVLIHIHPDNLLQACEEIHRCSARYIACVEYFSDKPEMIPYRGHDDRLFKRDFGDFWMEHFPDLTVLATGFAWKRITGLDNLTWWLFEKKNSAS
ncbi:pseudaminic acid biosynthesis-associated methylase [Tardiphaga alba]|nr:pseudaminic acid biosynthesis-associated methylase [Tardiphaga alba]